MQLKRHCLIDIIILKQKKSIRTLFKVELVLKGLGFEHPTFRLRGNALTLCATAAVDIDVKMSRRRPDSRNDGHF